MKRLVLFLFLLLIMVVKAGAQKIRFTDSGNVWKLETYEWGDPHNERTRSAVIKYDLDTIISNVVYKRLVDIPYSALGECAIREDTLSSHLYFRFITNTFYGFPTDTGEHLFFDYNLAINDTIRVDFNQTHFKHYVQSISTVSINGQSYKVWKMGGSRSYYFIEGIGTLNGPLFSVCPTLFENGAELLCFTNKGLTPPSSPPLPLPFAGGTVAIGPPLAVSFDNNSSCALAISDPKPDNLLSVVVPNPANSLSKIKLPVVVHSGSLSIYNAKGQRLVKQDIKDVYEVVMPGAIQEQGLYFYEIWDAVSRERFVGRFMFE